MFGARNGFLLAPQTLPAYVEEVFQTYLYTGNGSTQTITNGIDLAGEGGMVWIKGRNNTQPNALQDTSRGAGFILYSNDTSGQDDYSIYNGYLDQFNVDGFRIKSGSSNWNVTNNTYASWTFRKAPKFFDVVTYTGNDTARTIAHNLGSVPGMMIIKCTNNTTDWNVYHRSLGNTYRVLLNSTAQAFDIGSAVWNSTTPTSTEFSLGTNTGVNESGKTYVAYLFAHNAGGFGDAGTDNIISCGSFTTDGSGNATVNLGYEPQYLLIKNADASQNWFEQDIMIGWNQTQWNRLLPNLSNSEVQVSGNYAFPTSTGFQHVGSQLSGSAKYIYMAIRRGPMKTPTVGTSVFSPVLYSGNSGTQSITTGFPVDMEIVGCRQGGQGWEQGVGDRLRGNGIILSTAATDAENNWSSFIPTEFQSNTGTNRTSAYLNFSSLTFVDWAFRRAPGFFDIVCYTGDGTASRVISHNLTVSPELIISKARTGSNDWRVASSAIGFGTLDALALNSDAAKSVTARPVESVSSTTLTLSLIGANISTTPYVTYLFASVAGVSKVGSYTGTGSTQTINAGLPTGARFVMIKRTDDVGNWFVWDTARGMVAGTDPRLALNSTAAEINNNWVYTVTNGFQIVTSDATVNASGGSYIYLAIA